MPMPVLMPTTLKTTPAAKLAHTHRRCTRRPEERLRQALAGARARAASATAASHRAPGLGLAQGKDRATDTCAVVGDEVGGDGRGGDGRGEAMRGLRGAPRRYALSTAGSLMSMQESVPTFRDDVKAAFRHLTGLAASLVYGQAKRRAAFLGSAAAVLSVVVYFVDEVGRVEDAEAHNSAFRKWFWVYLLTGIYFVVEFVQLGRASRWSRSYLLSPLGLVDLLASVPPVGISVWLLVSGGWRCATCNALLVETMRILSTFRIFALLRLHILIENALIRKSFEFSVQLFGLVFVFSAMLSSIEGHKLQEMFYFAIVSITTVGYNDGDVKATTSRMIVVGLVLTTMVLLPMHSQNIFGDENKVDPTGGSTGQGKAAMQLDNHVVVAGPIRGGLSNFLDEFFHPDHGQDPKTKVVILTDDTVARLTINLTLFNRQRAHLLKHVMGCITEPICLDRVALDRAGWVFLLGDNMSLNPVVDDYRTILGCMAVLQRHMATLASVAPLAGLGRRRSSRVRQGLDSGSARRFSLCVKLLLSRSKRLLYHMLLEDQTPEIRRSVRVFCNEEATMQLFAKSCVCPGFSTFLSNLLVSTAGQQTKPATFHDSYAPSSSMTNVPEFMSWEDEYYRGAAHEIYKIKLGEGFRGIRFRDMCSILFGHAGIIVFAISLRVPGTDEDQVFLNPAELVIPSPEVYKASVFVIAQDRPQCEALSFKGSKQHRRSAFMNAAASSASKRNIMLSRFADKSRRFLSRMGGTGNRLSPSKGIFVTGSVQYPARRTTQLREDLSSVNQTTTALPLSPTRTPASSLFGVSKRRVRGQTIDSGQGPKASKRPSGFVPRHRFGVRKPQEELSSLVTTAQEAVAETHDEGKDGYYRKRKDVPSLEIPGSPMSSAGASRMVHPPTPVAIGRKEASAALAALNAFRQRHSFDTSFSSTTSSGLSSFNKSAKVPVRRNKSDQMWNLFGMSSKTMFTRYHLRTQPISQSKVTMATTMLKDFPRVREHVLVYLESGELSHFVLPLRERVLGGIIPIVFVTSEPFTQEEWKLVSYFPDVYVCVGQPGSRETWIKAGVKYAARAILTSQRPNVGTEATRQKKNIYGQPVTEVHKPQPQATAPPGESDSAEPGAEEQGQQENVLQDVDGDTICLYNTILRENRELNIMCEIQHKRNIGLLNHRMANASATENLSPVFASGLVLSASAFDSLMAQTFYNDNLVDIIEMLVGPPKVAMGAMESLGSTCAELTNSSFFSVPVTTKMAEMKFEQVSAALSKQGILPVCIRRGVQERTRLGQMGNRQPYIVTCPDRTSRLFPQDSLFCLALSNPFDMEVPELGMLRMTGTALRPTLLSKRESKRFTDIVEVSEDVVSDVRRSTIRKSLVEADEKEAANLANTLRRYSQSTTGGATAEPGARRNAAVEALGAEVRGQLAVLREALESVRTRSRVGQ